MRSLTMKKTGGAAGTWRLTQKASREGGKIIDQDVPIWEGKRYLPRPGLAEDDRPIMRSRHWPASLWARQSTGPNPSVPHTVECPARTHRRVGRLPVQLELPVATVDVLTDWSKRPSIPG